MSAIVKRSPTWNPRLDTRGVPSRVQRGIAGAALGLNLAARGESMRVRDPEAHDRDVGLVAVLLEEQPLQHLGAFV